MPVYHQMGHDSENLLLAEGLERYRGAILSPINYEEPKVAAQIQRARAAEAFETIFDPQLYYPRTERGVLRDWDYFPDDFDTADTGSDQWWNGLCTGLRDTCLRLRPSAACSPAIVPNTYSDEYFSVMVRVGNEFAALLAGTDIEAVQTAIVSYAELSSPARVRSIASIISQVRASRVFLVLTGDTEPRRELTETEQLKGAMKLISLLEGADLPVIVGFCSSDLVLWKAAGASWCSTGKFFNLRRFTRGRFDEPTAGGGQLPYWFEESLFAFVRESDLLRIRTRGLIDQTLARNPFAREIIRRLEQNPGQAWVALGWRQYLHWFSDFEERIANGCLTAARALRAAEAAWLDLNNNDVLMEEVRNDGSWLRPWRRAVAEFRSF
jgi:hypothetical protein